MLGDGEESSAMDDVMGDVMGNAIGDTGRLFMVGHIDALVEGRLWVKL